MNLKGKRPSDKEAIRRILEGRSLWAPQSGPQWRAYLSPADCILFGGSAGGGKTQILLGLALTAHSRSIIFRREYTQLKGASGLIADSKEILDSTSASFNAHELTWRDVPPDGASLDFGALRRPDDVKKFKGRPHDLLAFDELTEFTEHQFRYLQAWVRTKDPDQRTRIVAASNPPTTPEGKWVVSYWRPWLDPTYPDPAEPGELRYFVNLEDRDVEVEGPGEHDGLIPQSRTFIPSSVYDNPYYGDEYVSNLQSLPGELRRALLDGEYDVLAAEDDAFQLVKYDWVVAAQERWSDRRCPAGMTHLGVDVARGGGDRTVFAPRYDNYIDTLRSYPGKTTRRGNDVGTLVVELVGDRDPTVNVDSIGVGGAAYDYIADLDYRAYPINFAQSSSAYDRSGRYEMRNRRAEFYWKLRENLDPDLGGELALPEDGELLEELTAIHYQVSARGISIEKKSKIADRLGRSPDKADAVALSMGEAPVIFG